MFQIWRYRTSWEDFHSSTSWLKIFFDIFGRVMVSGVTKYGENLDWHQKVSRQTRVLTWLHDVITTGAWHHDIMTTWQLRGHFLDLDSACWQSALCSISRIFPHVYAVIPGPVPCQHRGNIYNLLLVARSQSPGCCIHSMGRQYTLHMHPAQAKLSFLAGAYRYPALRASCVKMNHWHPT